MTATEVTEGSPPDVNGQVRSTLESARAAAEIWSHQHVADRVSLLRSVRAVLLDRAEEVAATIAEETGKLEHEALLAEVWLAAELLEFYEREAPRILEGRRVRSGLLPHLRTRVEREAVGVVGVISPWNYPFVLAIGPVITALTAGNAVILKPSEYTPKSARVAADILNVAGAPPDLVSVLPGDGRAGEALVRSGVDLVVFTGSVETGRAVMRLAAETLTRVVLELGGKDAMIVCEDASLRRAVAGALWGACSNAGQTCMAVERVYVHESIHDEFVDRLVRKAKAVRPGIDMGMMTTDGQVRLVQAQLEAAIAAGATVRTGGRSTARYFPPTVVTDVDESMALLRDETFGPVIPVIPVADDDEAVLRTNASSYGLTASVWTRDKDRADRIARRLHVGGVCINNHMVNYAVPAAPFGGVKASGFGRTHGAEGLLGFTRSKVVVRDPGWLTRDPYWMPVPPLLTNVGYRMLRLRSHPTRRGRIAGAVAMPLRLQPQTRTSEEGQ